MKLSKITEQIKANIIGDVADVEITSVAYDSRKVVPGSMFVCLKGFNVDGHTYIEKAIAAGAAAIVLEDMPENVDMSKVVSIQVEDTRSTLAYISAIWFDHPANKLTKIALTGTKGKTTTANMVKKILEANGSKVGMIGTMGAYIHDEFVEVKNTTPESYELHYLFDRMVQKGCSHVVMEVSSQALKQHRVDGIEFEYGAFLNISPDHIGPDQHKDFDEYKECKKMLFSQVQKTVVNIEADYWDEVTEDCKTRYTISAYKDADFASKNIENKWEPGFLGISFEGAGKLTETYSLNMPGKHNVENALIAASICYLDGVDEATISKALSTVSVKGRTQVIPEAAKFTNIVIDYAHNAISVESVLKTLREYKPERLICVFGGGGNKPVQRRFDMGQMSARYADFSVVTMDNPRTEPMEQINKDIIRGINSENGEYIVIDDRKEAIEYVIDHAGPNDIVALVGKGHEEHQEVGTEKFYFSELQVVLDYIKTK